VPGLASPVAPSVARSTMIERPVTSTAAPLGSIAGQPLILVPGRVRAEVCPERKEGLM